MFTPSFSEEEENFLIKIKIKSKTKITEVFLIKDRIKTKMNISLTYHLFNVFLS